MAILRFLFQAPPTDWIRFFLFFCGILLFILLAEKTRHLMGWQPEVNRKLVHILTGFLVILAVFIFSSARPLAWMAVIFIGVDYAGIRTGKLQGMHGTARESYGTVFYPLAFLILVLACWPDSKGILIIAMAILALSDASAAIVGENLKHPHEFRWGRDKKSIEGSVVMFAISWMLTAGLLLILPGRFFPEPAMPVAWKTALWTGAAVAVVATAMEALSGKGSDNLTAPLGAAFVLGFMLEHPVPDNVRFSAGLILGVAVAAAAWRVRFLTASGAVGTFLLAALVFGVGGWTWTVPILAFFVLSSLFSRFGKRHKARFQLMFEKTSTRDLGQVMANGGAAGTIVLLYHFFPDPGWYAVYLGALAAVTADTWATEIGVFSKTPPVSITNFRRVEPGTSGGVTLLGTASAFLGAVTIAAAGMFAAGGAWKPGPGSSVFWIVTAAGFAGSLFDSVLGATLQAQYRCPACGKITEKTRHCKGNPTLFEKGIARLNNDWVNVFCSLAGALVVLAVNPLFAK